MFTIDEILKATNGMLVQGPQKGRARSVCIDSRVIKKDELFMAVKGEVFDGHDFVDDVIKRGVRVMVVHKPVFVPHARVSVIRVENTTHALGDIARFHRLRFNVPVIALTGSAGKTTTKEMIATVLARRYKVLKNTGTQNNHIGVPLTLLRLKACHQIVVLECGTNQPGDMAWLADVIRPQMVIVTNIGASHLEKLKSPRGVLKEKWQLTRFMGPRGVVLLNADDPLLGPRVHQKHAFNIIGFGVTRKARWRACDIEHVDGCLLRFKIGRQSVTLNTCGRHHVYNALSAYTCGMLFKVPAVDCAAALQLFEWPEGRGQILRLGRGWLINDSYNANPLSMRCALQTLQDIKTPQARICVLADMLELGVHAPSLHRQVGRRIARGPIDVLITVGSLAGIIARQVRRDNKKIRVFSCLTAESAQEYLVKIFHNGDAVLIKGSRRMRMEQVVEFLLSSPKSGDM